MPVVQEGVLRAGVCRDLGLQVVNAIGREREKLSSAWLRSTSPCVKANAAEVTYGSYEALLANVDDVGRLQPVREGDAQFARETVQGAQRSCA